MIEEEHIYTCLIRDRPDDEFRFYSLGFNSSFQSIPVLRNKENAGERFKNFLELNPNLEAIVVDITDCVRNRLIHNDCVYFLEDDKLLREREYVHQHLDELAKKYGDKYIAVHNGAVIDSDKDDFTLAARIEELATESREPILITNPGKEKYYRENPSEKPICMI